MNKTKYRVVSNGYWDILEYRLTYIPIWKKVWRPYFDEIWGRMLHSDSECVVNSLRTDLDWFVRKWPYIKEYFEYAKVEQKILEEKAQKARDIKEAKRKNIKYY